MISKWVLTAHNKGHPSLCSAPQIYGGRAYIWQHPSLVLLVSWTCSPSHFPQTHFFHVHLLTEILKKQKQNLPSDIQITWVTIETTTWSLDQLVEYKAGLWRPQGWQTCVSVWISSHAMSTEQTGYLCPKKMPCGDCGHFTQL
jgi:hypothetical protein